MRARAGSAGYVLALVAVVVIVDVLFFKHEFWQRLLANVGIVLLFVAFYVGVVRRPQPPDR